MQDKLSQNKRRLGQIKFRTNYCRTDDGNTKIKSVLCNLKKLTKILGIKVNFTRTPFKNFVYCY